MAVPRSHAHDPAADRYRQGFQDLRARLLDLHKAVLDTERTRYERIHGRIVSHEHLLSLVTSDPWFIWLRPLIQLVIKIDDALEAPDQDEVHMAQQLLAETRALLRPSEYGDGFARCYYEALQRSPDVVLAHSKVKLLIGG